MGIEQNTLFETNRNKYIDFREAFSDSELSPDEQQDIQAKYYNECDITHGETQNACDELAQEVELYTQMTQMSRTDIQTLQYITGVENVDGLRGPNTFAKYMEFKDQYQGFGDIGPEILVQEVIKIIEEKFESFSDEQKKDIQKHVGTKADGIYGPNTLSKIIENFSDVAEVFLIQNSNDIDLQESIVGDEITPVDMPVEEAISTPEDLIVTEEQIIEPNQFEELAELESEPNGVGDVPVGESIDIEETPEETLEVIEVFEAPEVIQVETLTPSMTQEELDLKKQEISQSPEYREARELARSFSRTQIQNIQTISGADIDGVFGVETYLYFSLSQLARVGFTLQEMADMKKIVSESDLESLLSQIQEVYLIPPEVTFEMFGPLSVGDYILYDELWGEMTHYDVETGRKGTLDVATGINDTIRNAFDTGGYEVLLGTLDRIQDPAQRSDYIDMLTSYITEHELFEDARILFSDHSIVAGRDTYTLDFRGNIDLGNNLTASDIFNDQDYLLVHNTSYIRNGEDYFTIDGTNTRLELRNGTPVSFPTPEDIAVIDSAVNEIVQKENIRIKIEDNLSQVLSDGDTESILLYCSLFSEAKRRVLLYNIQQSAREGHKFVGIRSIFASESSPGNYTINMYNDVPGVGSLFENGLTAFELFGDFKQLESQGETYFSLTETDYTVSGNRLAIRTGSEIRIIQDSLRTQEEYERIGEHPQLAKDCGDWIQRNYVNNGDNSCGASVGDALRNFGISGLPTSGRDGYRWKGILDARPDQFLKVPISHPSEAKSGGIITFGQNALKGTRMRRDFGHVEIAGANKEFYSYYHSTDAAGSARSNATGDQYRRDTAFEGFVYYPVSKA